MKIAFKRERALMLAHRQGILRAADVAPLGISASYLSKLSDQGYLQRVGRGLFSVPEPEFTEHRSLVEAAAYAPKAIVCLLSALAFHGIGTQLPYAVWLAIGLKDRPPQVPTAPVEIVRMGPRFLREGVKTYRIEGVPVCVTSPAKTVADCFKYRSRVGMDVALEALREGLRSRRFTSDELYYYAKLDRVWNILRPYAEAIS